MTDADALYWSQHRNEIAVKVRQGEPLNGLEREAFSWQQAHYEHLQLAHEAHQAELEAIADAHEKKVRGLVKLTTIDPLTGLGNLRALEQRMANAMKKINKGMYNNFFVAFDLDGFKAVNDTYKDHSVGDGVLIRTANLLNNTLHLSDSNYRPGGDEFVSILVDVTPRVEDPKVEGMSFRQILSQEMRHAVEIINPIVIGYENAIKSYLNRKAREYDVPVPKVTISAGIARIEPGIPWKRSFKAADKALYFAKEHGKNSICTGE